MAQNMKISLVKQSGENIIITVTEHESFEEFQTRILNEHNFSLGVDNFSLPYPILNPTDNLYNYLKQNHLEGDITGTLDDTPIFQILLDDDIPNEETSIKCEKDSPFVSNDNIMNEQYDAVYKEVENLDPSLMELNQTNVLNENIFEPTEYQQNPDKKLEDTNQRIILYDEDDVLMTNDYQLVENNTLSQTTSDNQPPVVVNQNVENGNKTCDTQNVDTSKETEQNVESYNYMDIESKLREIHDYTEENMTDLCRLCAGNIVEGMKLLIYNETDKLGEKINEALPIKVSKEDGLPQQLCEICTNRLKTYHEFVQTVLEADKVLRLKFTNTNCINENLKESTVSEFMTEFLGTSPTDKSEPDSEITKIVKFEPEDPNLDYETEYLDNGEAEKKCNSDTLNCKHCDLILDNLQEAFTHSIQDHNIGSLVACTFCDLGFQTSAMLQLHLEREHRNIEEDNLRRNKRFQCNTCLKKYGTYYQLHKHTCAKNTSNKTLHCEVCNQAFPSKVRLNFHRQFHLKDARPLFCSLCNLTFDDENEFFDHVNFTHDSKELFACNICDKTFSIRAALNNHKKTHTGVRNYRCEVCHKSFLDRQTLREHEVSHMNTKPYQCHICGKNLNRLSRLRRHLLTHESNPVVNDIHVCGLCKETFADEQGAKFHEACQHENQSCIEVVSTDKVFRCEYCEKCYSTPEALNEHRTLHSGPTPFVCHICRAEFSSYARCTTHKTTHGLYKDGAEKDNYPVVKHFLCEHCGKSYLHWTYLGLHRRLKHSEVTQVYKCSECDVEFPNSWSFAYHRKSKHNQETFKCPDCGKNLSNYNSLKLHRLSQHSNKRSKDIQCEKCGKSFLHQSSLEAHLKLHQGIREYKCTMCPKSFVHLSGLSNHIKLHKTKQKTYDNKRSAQKSELLTKLIQSSGGSDRPFTCDECGLSFRRQFSLKNHKHKHGKAAESGSFVLMVDMKEDENAEGEDKAETSQVIQTLLEDKQQQDSLIQLQPAQEMVGAENYIDIGNGNYIQVQGNTFNFGGKEYILVDENGKTVNRNEEFEMIVDETLREDEPAAVDTTNLIPQQQFDNNAVMLVESDNSYVLNQNVQSDYIFTTDERTIAKEGPTGTTYVIGGNQFLLETNDQAF